VTRLENGRQRGDLTTIWCVGRHRQTDRQTWLLWQYRALH